MTTPRSLSVLADRGHLASLGGSALGALSAVALGALAGSAAGDPDAGMANIALVGIIVLALVIGTLVAIPFGCYWALRRSGHQAAGLTAALVLPVLALPLFILINSRSLLLLLPLIVIGSPLVARTAALAIVDTRSDSDS